MTTIQTVTSRPDHGPSNDHVHRWRRIAFDGIPEQCQYGMCQAVGVTTVHEPDTPTHHMEFGQWRPKVPRVREWSPEEIREKLRLTLKDDERKSYASYERWSLRERLKDRYQGPPIYDEAPSDICSNCGGVNPCTRCIPYLLETGPIQYTEEEEHYIPGYIRRNPQN